MFSNESITEGGANVKNVSFPYLAVMMVKHGVTKTDISKTIEKSYRQTTLKLRKKSPILLNEAIAIKGLFVNLGEENLTVEQLFYGQPFSNESMPN